MKPRLLLADDHALVLDGLKRILESDFDVVGCAENGRDLLRLARALKPDAVLLDISMPLLNGLETSRRLVQFAPPVKVIFLTMHADAEYVKQAFRSGAAGYLLKRSVAAELVNAIHQVLEGKRYLSPGLNEEIATAPLPKPTVVLTIRQREVLQLVAEGRSLKQIAAVLGVSSKTVEFHKAALTQRLGIHTTAELTRYAIEHGDD